MKILSLLKVHRIDAQYNFIFLVYFSTNGWVDKFEKKLSAEARFPDARLKLSNSS